MSHSDLILFLFSLSILLSVAIIFGRIAQKIGVPKVIGELLGGIVLGPTVLGMFFPGVQNYLFAHSSPLLVSREILLKFGAILLLFTVGLEVNLIKIKELKNTIVWTSLFGLAVPFCLASQLFYRFLRFGTMIPRNIDGCFLCLSGRRFPYRHCQ